LKSVSTLLLQEILWRSHPINRGHPISASSPMIPRAPNPSKGDLPWQFYSIYSSPWAWTYADSSLCILLSEAPLRSLFNKFPQRYYKRRNPLKRNTLNRPHWRLRLLSRTALKVSNSGSAHRVHRYSSKRLKLHPSERTLWTARFSASLFPPGSLCNLFCSMSFGPQSVPIVLRGQKGEKANTPHQPTFDS